MKKYTVVLFGESRIDHPDRVKQWIFYRMYELASTKEHVAFLVGQDTVFDLLAVTAFWRARYLCGCDNISLHLILAHLHPDFVKDDDITYYDRIDFSREIVDLPLHQAIPLRNRQMVDRADLVMCWVEGEGGDAWNVMKYARRNGKNILNLYERGQKSLAP